jgi:hypothetical protein
VVIASWPATVIRVLRDGFIPTLGTPILEGGGVASGDNYSLLLLGLIAVAFYFAGLYKMGLAAGFFTLISTLLLFVFFWPVGVVAALAIAGYGLLPSFPTDHSATAQEELE